MYAVIESGGKQHKVVEGEVLKLEKIDAEAGETVSFDKVMMIGSDEKVTVGQPYVDAGVYLPRYGRYAIFYRVAH